ncbi:MAG: RodZ domain-containing protein [Oxalobacteraceae bacterium]
MMTEEFKDINDDLDQSQSQDDCIDSPGAYLSARRQALGWSIEQVADQIKLAPRQVFAIECDDYMSLPPLAVTRGFIRTYAKCLKVDVTPLLAMVKSSVIPEKDMQPLRRAIPMNFSESRFPLMGSRKSALSKWSMGVIILILLLLSVFLAEKMGWLPDSSKVMDAASIVRGESTPVKISSHTEDDVLALKSDAANVDAMITSVLAPASVSRLKDGEHVPVVASLAAPIDAVETDQLVLQAHEDTWVEIKGTNNRIVLSRILKAGEIQKFKISEPVLLTIGNVSGIRATFRGESLNTKANGNGNVARITLK